MKSDRRKLEAITVDHEGRTFWVDADGMPGGRVSSPRIPLDKPTIILINGFDFDPTEKSEDNPHRTLFRDWREQLQEIPQIDAGDWNIFRFGWYSAELELSSWGGAILHGRYNPYRWGWDLAGEAAKTLAGMIGFESADQEVYIVAHSLGSRVAIGTLAALGPKAVDRTLLLNGAEYSQTAKVISAHSKSEVLNIRVRADDVLGKLGSLFAPDKFYADVVGRNGIIDPPKHWCEVVLDDANTQAKAAQAGWENLKGDNPEKMGDHWYSYLHEPNWALYTDFLSGAKSAANIRSAIG